MSRSLPRWFAPGVLALALGAELGARADDLQDAKRWVSEGDASEAAHDYPTAISKYQLALRVKRTPQIYLRLGLAQEENGSLADAMRSYEAAAPLAAGNNDALSLVSEKIEKLRPRLGYVSVALSAPAASTRVIVNDTPVTDLGGETAVNPGDVTVRASAPARVDFSQHLRVAAGEHAKVTIALSAQSSDVQRRAPIDSPAPHPSVAGIVLIGVGVVGLAAGAGVLAKGLMYESDLAAQCMKGSDGLYGCPPSVTTIDGLSPGDLRNKSNVFQGVGGATLGVGAAAGIVGGVLLGLSLKSHDSTNAQLAPILGPTTAGAVYSQKF